MRNELVKKNRLVRQWELEVLGKGRRQRAATRALAHRENDEVSA